MRSSLLFIVATVVVMVAVAPTWVAAQCSDGYNCNCTECSQNGYNWYCSNNQECYSYHFDCAAECSGPCENVEGCFGCNSGFNCTCPQCQTQGYSYYCTNANECYDSYATCSVSCQYTADCQPTTACAPRSTCQSDTCTANQTCCVDSNGAQFCAPYENAVCCEYNQMACPFNHTCDPPSGQCLPPPPTPSSNCLECQKVVSFIESHSCGACAATFPALAWLCSLINEMGLCTYITSHELPPLNMCEIIGFCGNSGCTCGYCRPSLYGQWCLSLPNVCPATIAKVDTSISGPPSAIDRHHVRKQLDAVRLALGARDNDTTFCVDGWCDENHNGCCLTCA